jgi:putative transposase
VADQRTDFLHPLSRRRIDDHQAIYVESLNVKGMLANHHLAKSISDAGWGEFLRQLQYKAAWTGRTLEAIDRFYPSSRLCRKCGFHNADLTLADREWDCPDCRTHHDRDMNAAGNILDAGQGRVWKQKPVGPERSEHNVL